MSEERKTSKRKALVITGGLVLLAIIIGIFFAYTEFQKKIDNPLGQGLGLPTYTPTSNPSQETSGKNITETPTDLQAKAQNTTTEKSLDTSNVATSLPTVSPTKTPEPLCGGPPVMYILGIGVDTEDDSYTYGLGDVIRIARVDFITPKVTVVSIPRDLWVEIPEINTKYDITHGKLNQSYFYGGPGMDYYHGPGGGPGLMARTIDLNFGLRVDHYGALNMRTFKRIIDAVGGIDIYLPTDVDGTTVDTRSNMGYFYAGQHHFSGDEALRFSRIRKNSNDFNRMSNQNMVICALREKLLNASVLPKIPKIINSFVGSVQTDLSVNQIMQLACLLPKVSRENLIFTSLPKDLFTPGRVYSPQLRNQTFILEADYEEIQDYLQKFAEGTWPDKPKEPTCP
jgi:LCP family protein required for cell wall assembly